MRMTRQLTAWLALSIAGSAMWGHVDARAEPQSAVFPTAVAPMPAPPGTAPVGAEVRSETLPAVATAAAPAAPAPAAPANDAAATPTAVPAADTKTTVEDRPKTAAAEAAKPADTPAASAASTATDSNDTERAAPAADQPHPAVADAANPVAPADTPAAAAEPAASAPPAPATESRPIEAAAPTAVEPEAAALLASIKDRAARLQVQGADKEALAALKAHYDKPSSAPLWIARGTFNARAKSALKALREADDWGLDAKAFPVPAEPSASATSDQQADAELKLGIETLRYARFASGGRLDPGKLSKYIDVKPPVADPAVVLASLSAAEDANAMLTGLHPKHVQFVALRAALLKARAPAAEPQPAVAAAPPVVKIPDGPLLKTGSKHDQVALLRQRLGVPAASPEQERVFDPKVADALKAFQREAEIKPTGVLNRSTRQALNGDAAEPKPEQSTPQKTVQRIVLNMERWRWLPSELGAMYVWDNIPEFMTRVIKDGRTIHKEKIIVGKTNTQTPIFSARMQYVVFHPEWGVPDSIKVKEILPYLRRPAQDGFFAFGGGSVSDTRVLQRHNLKVSMNGRPVDASQIDWSTTDIRRYQFIQPSGGQNVLGVVKFRFPNKHDVYMHDTPQRELFNAKTRTFSHGCMRVHNPQKLAEVLLGEDQGMSPSQVAGLIARGGGSTEISLKTQVPVHVTYMTAVVDESGKLETYSDIYGHDSRLQLALSGKQTEFFDPPDVAERPEALARQARVQRKAPPTTQIGPVNFLSALFGN